MKKFVEKDVAENPLYHDTWKLLNTMLSALSAATKC